MFMRGMKGVLGEGVRCWDVKDWGQQGASADWDRKRARGQEESVCALNSSPITNYPVLL